MKRLPFFLVSLSLIITSIVGCSSNQTASATNLTQAIVAQASIVRAVVASQPAGPKRDQLLADIDSAILVGNVAVLEEKLAEASAIAPATTPTK